MGCRFLVRSGPTHAQQSDSGSIRPFHDLFECFSGHRFQGVLGIDSLKSVVKRQRLVLVFLVVMALAAIGKWSLSPESLRADADSYTVGFGALPFGKFSKEQFSTDCWVSARDETGSIFPSSVCGPDYIPHVLCHLSGGFWNFSV